MKFYSEESKYYNEEDKEILIDMGKELELDINDAFSSMAEDLDWKYYNYTDIARDYGTLAKLSMLIHEDVKKAREYFFLKTLYGITAMKNKSFFIRTHNTFLINFNKYEYMYHALLSGNIDVAQRCASLMDAVGEDQTDYYLHLGRVLQNVILDNTKEAEKWLGYIDNYKNDRTFHTEMDLEIKMMRGINRKDEAMFNEGLSNIIKKSERRLKPEKSDWDDFLVTSAVALTALAKHRGMNITVKSVLLPDEYFADYDIDYKGIEENLRME